MHFGPVRKLKLIRLRRKRRRHPHTSFTIELRKIEQAYDLRHRSTVWDAWGPSYNFLVLYRLLSPGEPDAPLPQDFVEAVRELASRHWPKRPFSVAERGITLGDIQLEHSLMEIGQG